MRQHGAQRSEAPKRQRSPKHADLVGMSAAKRPQGHAQKRKINSKIYPYNGCGFCELYVSNCI
ncbi:MAG: hypothetical protein NZ455_16665 [Bacteroidia bacterium]|nr:hypothetical protein [Bacteroidia bacterium]